MRIFEVCKTEAFPHMNFYCNCALVIAKTKAQAIKAARENRVPNWSQPVRQDINEYNDEIYFVDFYCDTTHALNSKYLQKTKPNWVPSPEKPVAI